MAHGRGLVGLKTFPKTALPVKRNGFQGVESTLAVIGTGGPVQRSDIICCIYTLREWNPRVWDTSEVYSVTGCTETSVPCGGPLRRTVRVLSPLNP
eukprot:5697810-Pyramimonas_sp.AAC.1